MSSSQSPFNKPPPTRTPSLTKSNLVSPMRTGSSGGGSNGFGSSSDMHPRAALLIGQFTNHQGYGLQALERLNHSMATWVQACYEEEAKIEEKQRAIEEKKRKAEEKEQEKQRKRAQREQEKEEKRLAKEEEKKAKEQEKEMKRREKESKPKSKRSRKNQQNSPLLEQYGDDDGDNDDHDHETNSLTVTTMTPRIGSKNSSSSDRKTQSSNSRIASRGRNGSTTTMISAPSLSQQWNALPAWQREMYRTTDTDDILNKPMGLNERATKEELGRWGIWASISSGPCIGSNLYCDRLVDQYLSHYQNVLSPYSLEDRRLPLLSLYQYTIGIVKSLDEIQKASTPAERDTIDKEWQIQRSSLQESVQSVIQTGTSNCVYHAVILAHWIYRTYRSTSQPFIDKWNALIEAAVVQMGDSAAWVETGMGSKDSWEEKQLQGKAILTASTYNPPYAGLAYPDDTHGTSLKTPIVDNNVSPSLPALSTPVRRPRMKRLISPEMIPTDNEPLPSPSPLVLPPSSSSSSSSSTPALLPQSVSTFGSVLPAVQASVRSEYPMGLRCDEHNWLGPATETCPSCTSRSILKALPSSSSSSQPSHVILSTPDLPPPVNPGIDNTSTSSQKISQPSLASLVFNLSPDDVGVRIEDDLEDMDFGDIENTQDSTQTISVLQPTTTATVSSSASSSSALTVPHSQYNTTGLTDDDIASVD